MTKNATYCDKHVSSRKCIFCSGEKIVRSADQQEETSALLKRTGVIVKKLMDENDMLRNERQRLVEESVDVLKQRLEDTKELIAARRGD